MLPLISCLMVTLPVETRAAGRRRAIADYRRQSYPHRELVLVMDRGDPASHAALRAEVAALGDASISVVALDDTLTLGALRNASVAAARGQLLCQWDDDDLSTIPTALRSSRRRYRRALRMRFFCLK